MSALLLVALWMGPLIPHPLKQTFTVEINFDDERFDIPSEYVMSYAVNFAVSPPYWYDLDRNPVINLLQRVGAAQCVVKQ